MNLKLKNALEKNKLETREPYWMVARRAGISESLLSCLIQERRKPNPVYQEALAKALGCKVEDLFDVDNSAVAISK